MAAGALQVSEMLKGLPVGVWVAISEQRQEVIAYAADLAAVLESATQNGEKEPLIVRVPESAGMLFL